MVRRAERHRPRRCFATTPHKASRPRKITIAEVLKPKGLRDRHRSANGTLGHLPQFLPMRQGF